jgi:hypothetical protein
MGMASRPHTNSIGITTISAAWSGSRYRSGVVSVLIHAYPAKGVSRRLPQRYLFQISLRSRCTATLAGLRTLIHALIRSAAAAMTGSLAVNSKASRL